MSKKFYFKQFSLAWVHNLNVKIIIFQVIQFSKSSQFNSIWPTDRTLSGATTLDQSEPGSNDNEGIFWISQISSITGTSPSDCLVSYPEHSLGGGLTPLQRSIQCILQPQLTGQWISNWFIAFLKSITYKCKQDFNLIHQVHIRQ